MRFNRIFAISIVLLITASGFWLYPKEAQALGISPPQVTNNSLLRGSHFEQVVYINQGAPKENLIAKAQLHLSEKYKKWITVKPGLEFVIPQVRLFPFTVVVDVPEDAKIGERLNGEIKISTFPETQKEGQVSIGVGLAIGLDFTVSEELTVDYDVALWRILAMEDGWPLKMGFTLDNRGNTRTRPQKIVVTLQSRQVPSLGAFEAADLDYVEAFQRGEIIAEFPVKLAEDTYFIKIQLYKSEGEVLEFKTSFDVLPKGSLPRPPKPWWFWVLVGSGIALTGALIAALIKFRIKIISVLKGVFRFFVLIKRKFGKMLKVLKEKE